MKRSGRLMICIAAVFVLAGCGDSADKTARTLQQTKGVNEVLEAGMAAEEEKKNEADETGVKADSLKAEASEASEKKEAAQTAETSEPAENKEEAPAEGSTGTGVNADAAGNAEKSKADAAGNTENSKTDAAGSTENSNTDAVGSTVNGNAGQAGSTDKIDVDLTVMSSTMVYSEVYNMVTAPEQYIGKTVKMDGLFSFFHNEVTDVYYYACIIQDATACCAQGIEFVLKGDYTYPDDYPEPGEEICVEGVFDTYMEGETKYCTLRDAVFA